jgi:SAM-dependent methyltransferase
MTGRDRFADWDWENPDTLNPLMDSFTHDLAEVDSIEPVAAERPYTAAELDRLGITGIEFAAFSTEHPTGLATDLVGVHSRDAQTEPGRLYRIAGRSYFEQLDIGEPLPFADASVSWVYAEHLIEHVPLAISINWLTEVHRVLRPGGVLRLTTPDLAKYVLGYLDGNKFFAKHRRRVNLAVGVAPPMPARNAFMFNQIFYLYGHRWLYDLAELQYVLGRAGFDPSAVRECGYRDGSRLDVAALDRTIRNDETIYVEVTR